MIGRDPSSSKLNHSTFDSHQLDWICRPLRVPKSKKSKKELESLISGAQNFDHNDQQRSIISAANVDQTTSTLAATPFVGEQEPSFRLVEEIREDNFLTSILKGVSVGLDEISDLSPPRLREEHLQSQAAFQNSLGEQ